MNHSNERMPVGLLDRYLVGIATREEHAQVEAWIGEDPRRRLDVLQRGTPSPQAREALERVFHAQAAPGATSRRPQSRLGGRFAQPRTGSQTPPRSMLRMAVWAPVALTALIAAVLVWGREGQERRGDPSTVRTYATSVGQQTTFTLDDGTRVTLAPQTTLRLTDFNAHARTLTLDGEAYFDVKHASGAPFIVRTGAVNTKVLGTSFAVRRYAADASVRVAVETGKVAVSANTSRRPSVVLTAGVTGEITDSTATVAPASDMTPYTGWRNGRLAFHDTPTADVLKTLSRWYDYEFRVADSTLSTRNITIVLSTQSITSAFATIRLVLDADLVVDGKIVTVTSRKGQPLTRQESQVRTRRHWEQATPRYKEIGR